MDKNYGNSSKKFVCCDCSSDMIKIAQKRFNRSNVMFLASDVREIDFENEFDIITAIQVNHYLHDQERKISIKKCYQALRTGGLFITFENFAPFSEFGKHLYLERWKAYQLEQGKTEKECGFITIEILWLSYMQVGIWGIK